MNKSKNPIKLLVKYRLDNFIKKFNIKIEFFNFRTTISERKASWLELKQKLILHKYVTTDSNFIFCFVAIQNVLWKNIIQYKAIQISSYRHMIHSGDNDLTPLSDTPSFHIGTLLNKNFIDSNNNLDILEQKIINNLLLLHQIIVKYLILDLLHITKMYIFNAWLFI